MEGPVKGGPDQHGSSKSLPPASACPRNRQIPRMEITFTPDFDARLPKHVLDTKFTDLGARVTKHLLRANMFRAGAVILGHCPKLGTSSG